MGDALDCGAELGRLSGWQHLLDHIRIIAVSGPLMASTCGKTNLQSTHRSQAAESRIIILPNSGTELNCMRRSFVMIEAYAYPPTHVRIASRLTWIFGLSAVGGASRVKSASHVTATTEIRLPNQPQTT